MLGECRISSVFRERVLGPIRGDLVNMFEDRFKRAPLADQRFGRFLADPGNARNVVRGVSHQRLVIGDQFRAEAVAIDDRRDVVIAKLAEPTRARKHREDVVVDELQEIAVAGDDDHVVPVVRCRTGEGADHVIGLVPWFLKDRNAKRRNQLANAIDLLAEVFGHFSAGRLVAVV